MKTFCDSQGREWSIAVTIGSVKRVKDLLQVDLLKPNEGEPVLVTRLNSDVAALIDVVFALLKPQADQLGVSDAAFAEALDGGAAYAAYLAFMEEWRDFFQSLHREDLARMVAKTLALVRKAVELQDRMVGREAEAMDRKLTEIEADGSGLTSGNTPAGPASTQTA